MDIELVIKIDEEDYEIMKHNIAVDNPLCPLSQAEIVTIIANGIPFPKEHGRIGDLDALETEMINGINAGNYEDGYENYSHINNMDDCVECVRYADTIIKANME